MPAKKGRITTEAEFEYVVRNSPIVYGILVAGGTAEDCVVHLFEYQQKLLKRLLELDAIAPRKIKQLDGSFLIWRCPDERVPER